jgi:hypothetical protein
MVAAAKIIYLEGYLWDPPAAKDAFRRAAEIAHASGRRVAITLSDSFCVDRFRDEFLDLLRTGTVDIVFANEAEAKSLYQTSDFDSAVAGLKQDAKLSAITLGARGSLVVTRAETHHVPVAAVDNFVDSMRPASWRDCRAARICRSARRSAVWRQARSSRITAPVHRRACAMLHARAASISDLRRRQMCFYDGDQKRTVGCVPAAGFATPDHS